MNRLENGWLARTLKSAMSISNGLSARQLVFSSSDNERGKSWHQKLVSKYGKAKSLSIIAQRIGRAVYSILKKRTAFNEQLFYESLNV